MPYSEQNPPAVENPYDYTNPDIRQLAALVNASGDRFWAYNLFAQCVSSFFQLATPASPQKNVNPAINLILPDNTTLTENARFAKIYISVPKTYNLTGTEKVKIIYGQTNGYCLRSFYLVDVMKLNASGEYDVYCTGEIGLSRLGLNANPPFSVTVSGILAGQSIGVGVTCYLFSSGDEKSETPTNIARYQTNINITSAVSMADLVTQVNAYKAANPANTIVNEAYTQGVGEYNAVLTVIIL